MTFTSVAQANSKTAQFACLFDLFDRVATRRTRALTGDTSEVISADDIANVPAEFAPVLKNLSTTLSLRALRDGESARRVQAASTSRTHRNTLADAPLTPPAEKPMSRVDTTEEDAESPTFPLGERYPFTFKLMLHKLYDLDEWADKVKNAVETSRLQFKPLAERVQNVVRDVTANINERGEKRNAIRPILGVSAKFKPPSSTRRPHSAATHSSKPETSRVLKKRCIGRRKSLSGPMSTGVWVHDAAISATEVTGPHPALEITLSMPSRDAGGVAENRARHQSMTALEEMQGRGTAKRKVKIAVPLLQEEVSESDPLQRSSVSFAEPAQEIIKTESVVKRSVASAFASEPACKMAAVKRPLCV